MTIISCHTTSIAQNIIENPFLQSYTTPFQVPPFDKIKVEHYMPAFKEGMKQQQAEIDAIIANIEAATFENTILAYDKSGELLSKVSDVFFNVNETDTDDKMQEVAREITPLITQHSDNISMNLELFKRIKTVYEKRFESKLDSSQIRVTEKYYEDFVRDGANLNKADQDKLRKLNEEIANAELAFGENVLAETNNFLLIIDKKEDLAGLPKEIIDAAAETAKETKNDGKWVFTTSRPSIFPFLQYSEKRELREKLYKAYLMRGNNDNKNDNKKIVIDIVQKRAEKAKLLGFKNHAEYVLVENMAKTPDAVNKFLSELWTPALKNSKEEVAEMQLIIDKEGGKFKLAAWDWWFYADKVKKEKFKLDDNELKPYFKLENVREGMFWLANKLYGITFSKLENIPVFNKEVEVYEVKESDGKHIGLLYLDYFPRASKGSGAWCTSFREASYDKNGNRIYPLSSITCNFTKPTKELPSLLNLEEVTTLFHEFGHTLHGLFTDGKYDRTAGNVPRDYVELPSQIMENWATEPEVLKHYAKHYKTGVAIPDELIAKIQNAGKFNQGFETVEYLAASILDIDFHLLNADENISDVVDFEAKAMNKIGLISEIAPRYRSTYFSHIFDGGYSAGYFAYMWAAVLDADAFNAFKESGDLFNKDLATKFRKHCLSECGENEGMVQYVKFRGKQPSVEPLLIRRGLK